MTSLVLKSLRKACLALEMLVEGGGHRLEIPYEEPVVKYRLCNSKLKS